MQPTHLDPTSRRAGAARPYVTYPLAQGDLGIAQTIATMQRLIDAGSKDPRVRAFALDIVRQDGVPPRDDQGEVNALFHWVQQNFRFTKDPAGKEVVGTIGYLLETRAGDCDDYVVVLGTLLRSLGHAVRIVTIAADPKEPARQSHVFLQARVSGQWVGLDATQDHAYVGWEPPRRYSTRVWGTMMPRRVSLGAYRLASRRARGLGQDSGPSWSDIAKQTFEQAAPVLTQAAASKITYGTIPRAEGQFGLNVGLQPPSTSPNAGLIALGIGAALLAIAMWRK